jgi:hypothetical protein
MFHHHMHNGRWDYGRPGFFRGPRLFRHRGCFPGCGCGFLLPLLLIGGLAFMFLAHIL